MWTNENRNLYDRSKLRYPSDLIDEEWALVEPAIPPAKRGRGQTDSGHARGRERRHVYPLHRLPMAGSSQRPAAAQHGAWLSRPLELGWNARTHPSCPLCEMSRAGG